MKLERIREKIGCLNRLIAYTPTRAREVYLCSLKKIVGKMNEKLIERKLREGAKRMGGVALKFASPYFTGMPDRAVLLPGGRVAFAEIKTTGKKPSPRQRYVIGMLRGLGFTAGVIDSQEGLDSFLNELQNERK